MSVFDKLFKRDTSSKDNANSYGAVENVDKDDGADDIKVPEMFDKDEPSSGYYLKESFRQVHDGVENVLNKSLSFRGAKVSIRDLGGTATIPNEVINVAKNLVGAGVLSLSGGIAIYADDPMAAWTGSMWIVLLGVMFGYFCLLIAKTSKITKAVTYRECWEVTMGNNGWALAVSWVNALKPALGNLAYSTILSQTLESLLQGVNIYLTRVECLLIVTFVAILPLCLLKQLSVLAPFSVIGTAGIIMSACAMVYRYIDGSYQPGGKYFEDIDPEYQPYFGNRNLSWSTKVLPLLCMIFEAYVMHYNSPRFFAELKRATIPRFTGVVAGSFGLSAAIYITIASAGFLTFGGHSDGYILNNYSPDDPLATLCRIAIGLSTLTTYPVVFIGFRDGMLGVLRVPDEKQTSGNINLITVVLLAVITFTAIFVTDLGQINAVGGGSLATFLVFVFPTLMYQKAVYGVLGDDATVGHKREVIIAWVLMIIGCILGVIGVVEALQTG